MPVEISKTERPNAVILKLSGKFDLEQADAFMNQFKLNTENKPAVVCMNMTDVQFIDSSGLGALIKALNMTKNNGGEMILFGLNQVIQNVFKLAKLDNFFKLMEEEEFDRKYPAEE